MIGARGRSHTRAVADALGSPGEEALLREVTSLVVPLTSKLPWSETSAPQAPEQLRRALEAVLPRPTCLELVLQASASFEPFEMQAYVLVLARAAGAARSHVRALTGVGVPLDNVAWCYLVQAVGALPALERLDLRDLQLGDYFGDRLGAQLRRAPQLRTLCLARNRLGRAALDRLGALLQHPGSALAELDLSGNDLAADDLAPLAYGVARSGALAVLRLGGNRLGNEGARILGLATGESRSLRTLDVSANRIGSAGAVALVAGIAAGAAPLEELDLSRNGIGERALDALQAWARASSSLRVLRVGGNPLRPCDVLVLLAAQHASRSLEEVAVDGGWAATCAAQAAALRGDPASAPTPPAKVRWLQSF